MITVLSNAFKTGLVSDERENAGNSELPLFRG